MAKMILEFDLEEERKDVEKIIMADKIYSVLWDFEQAMRSAEKFESGFIWEKYLKEKEIYPEENDANNMLDAIRKVYYELTEPFRELIQ
jgi:hypothetical protein